MVELLPNKFALSDTGFKTAILLLVLVAVGFLIGCNSISQDVTEKPPLLASPEAKSKPVQDVADKVSASLVVDSHSSEQQPEISEDKEKDIDNSLNGITNIPKGNSKEVETIVNPPERFGNGPEMATQKPYEADGFYEDAKVQIRGKYLPELVPGYQDTAIGLKAPEIKGKGLDGVDVYIGGEGPTTLIMVLAHWCPHCRNEVRELSPFLNETDSLNRVRMITLLTSINEERANFPPHTWLDLENWPVPSIVDTPSSQIAAAYGVNSFPFFIVINDVGQVALRLPGRLGVETLVELLDAIDGMDEARVEN